MMRGTPVSRRPTPARPSHVWIRLQRVMRLFTGCCRFCQELLQILPVLVIISAPFVFLALWLFCSAVFFL